MPDHSQRMRKFWGVRCEPSHEKGLQIWEVASIFNNDTTLV
jgi:hypothetical protein